MDKAKKQATTTGIPALKAKKVLPISPMTEGVDETTQDITPPEIQDKLQTMKNNRAADQYEKNKTFKSGGKVGSASKRADGCCVKGKTRGKMC